MTRRLICPLVLGFALAATPAPAEPDPAAGNRVAIEYRDLDLATQGGRRALHRRVREAAARLCRKSTRGEIVPFHAACVTRTMASARAQVRLAERGRRPDRLAQGR